MSDISTNIQKPPLIKKQKNHLKSTKPYIIPYLVWMFVLLVIPSLILLFLAFSNFDLSSISSNTNQDFKFTLENWQYIFGETAVKTFWPIFWDTIKISIIVTIITLLIGYPVAYCMTQVSARWRSLIMVALVLPLWSNQVLRIVSWRTIFEIIENGEITEGMYNINIIIAMVSMYLPFMTLPIFTVLEKIDPKIIEASYDLGCSRKQSFIKVTLPLSLGGVVSGVIMTFLPALTQFEVPYAISYGNKLLLGNIIYQSFAETGGFNIGSVYSIFTVVLTIVGFILVTKVDKEGETLI